jgi:hypothetical protein
LALVALLVIFGVIVLDEVLELVDLAVTRATVGAVVAHVLVIIGEDIGEAGALVAAVFIAVAALQTLELGLACTVSLAAVVSGAQDRGRERERERATT